MGGAESLENPIPLLLAPGTGLLPGERGEAHCTPASEGGAAAPCGGPDLPLLPPRAHLPEENHSAASLAHPPW